MANLQEVTFEAGEVLRFTDVSKTFVKTRSMSQWLRRHCPQKTQVLESISLNIHAGERVGIMGVNGSGKSTLLRLAAGVLLPSSGSVSTLGQPTNTLSSLSHPEVSLCNGDARSFFWRLTPRKNLEFFISLSGMPLGTVQREIQRFAEVLEIDHRLEHKFGSLSSGERQRVALIRTILHERKLLLLDEATKSLDIDTRRKVWEQIIALCEEREATLIFASHDLQEITNYASRLILLRESQVVYDGPPKGIDLSQGLNTAPELRRVS